MSMAIASTLTDQTVAADMLIAAKGSITGYAIALTETVSPQVRTMLRKQLDQSITAHEQITNYMTTKGWYNPFNIQQQIQIDIKAATTAMSLQ
jgi:similar to spore coat protein